MAVKNLYFTFYDKIIVGESRELQWGRNNLGHFSITFEGMKINCKSVNLCCLKVIIYDHISVRIMPPGRNLPRKENL